MKVPNPTIRIFQCLREMEEDPYFPFATNTAIEKFTEKRLTRTKEITMDDISDISIAIFETDRETFLSRCRKKESCVWPRMFSMFFCVIFTPFSLAKIGLYHGGRDHATILHAVNTILNALQVHDRTLEYYYERHVVQFTEKLKINHETIDERVRQIKHGHLIDRRFFKSILIHSHDRR